MKQQILAAAFITASAFVTMPVLAGDAVKGEALFKKCAACHKIGADAKNAVGPALTGVVGRAVAGVEDYKYGKSIVELGETGAVWTEEEIFEYLANPKKYLRAKLDNKKAKSKMSFKLKKEDQRNDVIAYLATFSPKAEEGDAASEEPKTEETTTEETTTTN